MVEAASETVDRKSELSTWGTGCSEPAALPDTSLRRRRYESILRIILRMSLSDKSARLRFGMNNLYARNHTRRKKKPEKTEELYSERVDCGGTKN